MTIRRVDLAGLSRATLIGQLVQIRYSELETRGYAPEDADARACGYEARVSRLETQDLVDTLIAKLRAAGNEVTS